MATLELRARDKMTSNWVKNFSSFGWRVRTSDNTGWIYLGPHNTKVRSADNTVWHNTK